MAQMKNEKSQSTKCITGTSVPTGAKPEVNRDRDSYLNWATDLAYSMYRDVPLPEVFIERIVKMVMVKAATEDEHQYRPAVAQRLRAAVLEYGRLFERIFKASAANLPG